MEAQSLAAMAAPSTSVSLPCPLPRYSSFPSSIPSSSSSTITRRTFAMASPLLQANPKCLVANLRRRRCPPLYQQSSHLRLRHSIITARSSLLGNDSEPPGSDAVIDAEFEFIDRSPSSPSASSSSSSSAPPPPPPPPPPPVSTPTSSAYNSNEKPEPGKDSSPSPLPPHGSSSSSSSSSEQNRRPPPIPNLNQSYGGVSSNAKQGSHDGSRPNVPYGNPSPATASSYGNSASGSESGARPSSPPSPSPSPPYGANTGYGGDSLNPSYGARPTPTGPNPSYFVPGSGGPANAYNQRYGPGPGPDPGSGSGPGPGGPANANQRYGPGPGSGSGGPANANQRYGPGPGPGPGGPANSNQRYGPGAPNQSYGPGAPNQGYGAGPGPIYGARPNPGYGYGSYGGGPTDPSNEPRYAGPSSAAPRSGPGYGNRASDPNQNQAFGGRGSPYAPPTPPNSNQSYGAGPPPASNISNPGIGSTNIEAGSSRPTTADPAPQRKIDWDAPTTLKPTYGMGINRANPNNPTYGTPPPPPPPSSQYGTKTTPFGSGSGSGLSSSPESIDPPPPYGSTAMNSPPTYRSGPSTFKAPPYNVNAAAPSYGGPPPPPPNTASYGPPTSPNPGSVSSNPSYPSRMTTTHPHSDPSGMSSPSSTPFGNSNPSYGSAGIGSNVAPNSGFVPPNSGFGANVVPPNSGFGPTVPPNGSGYGLNPSFGTGFNAPYGNSPNPGYANSQGSSYQPPTTQSLFAGPYGQSQASGQPQPESPKVPREPFSELMKKYGKDHPVMLKFIWLEKRLGLALDNVVSEFGSFPLTPYFFFPETDALSELKIAMEKQKWISSDRISALMKQAEELTTLWKQQTSVPPSSV